MEQPKLTKITYIEYNGELFQIGDTVHYVMECGNEREEATGRFIKITDAFGGILDFDCSREHESNIRSFNICNLKSISRAELGGKE